MDQIKDELLRFAGELEPSEYESVEAFVNAFNKPELYFRHFGREAVTHWKVANYFAETPTALAWMSHQSIGDTQSVSLFTRHDPLLANWVVSAISRAGLDKRGGQQIGRKSQDFVVTKEDYRFAGVVSNESICSTLCKCFKDIYPTVKLSYKPFAPSFSAAVENNQTLFEIS